MPQHLQQYIYKNSNIAHWAMVWGKRLSAYISGMFFLALGVAFSVKANLGISPVNSVPYVISQALNTDQGLVTIIIFSGFVFVQIPLLKKQFKAKHLLQIFCASLYGIFITLSNYILAFPDPNNYLIKLALLAVSIFLIAGGILLYLWADIVPRPPEGLMLAIQKRSGWQFPKIKTSFDCTMVLISLLIIVGTSSGVPGIREGTLITALGVGKAMSLLTKLSRT